jgi:hypothetical protein
MSRTFLDENFREWEAFASAGRFGLPDRAYIIFHCLTDRALPPRFLPTDGDKAAAERDVARLPDPELLIRLEQARLFRPADESPEPFPGGVPSEGQAGEAPRKAGGAV